MCTIADACARVAESGLKPPPVSVPEKRLRRLRFLETVPTAPVSASVSVLEPSQRALRSKKFNPDRKFQSRLEIFNLDRKFLNPRSKISIPQCVSIYGALLVLPRRARSKISIHDRSLEIFNPEGRDRIFSIPGPSGILIQAQSTTFFHTEILQSVPRRRCHQRFLGVIPDPPTLACLEPKKTRETLPKGKGFLFAEPLKSLEKEGKTHKKARKIGKQFKKESKKARKTKGQGCYVSDRRLGWKTVPTVPVSGSGSGPVPLC